MTDIHIVNSGSLTRISIFSLFFMFSMLLESHAQKYIYNDTWSDAGFYLDHADLQSVQLTYSVEEFTLTDIDLKGEAMKEIQLPGNFLPNNEGAPNLPGNARFIAVPNGAEVSFTITAKRVETYYNINIAPAPRIPKETDEGPLHYEKNMKIYARDAFYPAEPVKLSEKTSIRGIETVILGITPFQYNPVTKELKVYCDLKVEVSFSGARQLVKSKANSPGSPLFQVVWPSALTDRSWPVLLVPWVRLFVIRQLAKKYSAGRVGRKPYPLKVMLRVHVMQLLYNLSDPGMEDALYEIESMRRFAGLRLSDNLPDETTILNFRHFLEKMWVGEII